MNGRVILRHDAEEDIDSISGYIGRDNLQAARGFRNEVRREIISLSDEPGMGALRQFTNSRLDGVRSWPIRHFMNYLIFYRPIDGGVEVLRILHGARDIERIFRDGSS